MEKSKVVEHVCNNSDMIARHKKKGTINQSINNHESSFSIYRKYSFLTSLAISTFF